MPGLFQLFANLFGKSVWTLRISSWPNHGARPHATVPTLPNTTHRMKTGTTKALQNGPDMYTLQAQSLLISRLPLEIRNVIWTYVLGNSTLHLFYEDADTLRGYVCGNQNIPTCKSAAHGGEGFLDKMHWTGGTMSYADFFEVRDKGWMGALTACRASYFETSKILYSTSTFDLSDCWTQISSLQWSIPLLSLTHISRVTMTVVDLYVARGVINYAAWKGLWATLSLLKSLKHLRVRIASKDMEHFAKATMTSKELNEVEDELLDYARALKDVPGRRKAILEIVLPCNKTEGCSNVANALIQTGWKVIRI